MKEKHGAAAHKVPKTIDSQPSVGGYGRSPIAQYDIFYKVIY